MRKLVALLNVTRPTTTNDTNSNNNMTTRQLRLLTCINVLLVFDNRENSIQNRGVIFIHFYLLT